MTYYLTIVESRAMVALLLSLCCFVGCPLLMGVMWLMTRDREGPRLERELRRLNAEAEASRPQVAPSAPGADPARPESPAAMAVAEQADR